jgi:hypothetical protein
MIEKLGFDDCAMFCDGCGKLLKNYGDQGLYGTIAEAESAGWLIQKDRDSGEWEHWCPNCRGV